MEMFSLLARFQNPRRCCEDAGGENTSVVLNSHWFSTGFCVQSNAAGQDVPTGAIVAWMLVTNCFLIALEACSTVGICAWHCKLVQNPVTVKVIGPSWKPSTTFC